MPSKIPFEPTCLQFIQAVTDSGVPNDLAYLDVRLGLEQILDDPDYRAEATARWAADFPTIIEPGPDSALARFREVTYRNAALDVEAVRIGLEAIVDTEDFKDSALQRWARYDANPWPLVVADVAGFEDPAA